MRHIGNIELVGLGQIKNMRPEILSADPGTLFEGRLWYNTTDKVLKFYDGAEIQPIAIGGDLEDFLNRDGSLPMLDELVLSSDDQSASADNVAASAGYVRDVAATKQDTITGAATTITADNLTASVALVSDSNGKVAASAVTTAELAYLSGVTSSVQDQIDSKQDALGYTPLNKAGDSWLGNQSANGYRLIGLAAPVDASDAARKIDVDNALAGMNWQQDVNGVQVDATLDPTATPVTGDRYVITDAAALHANFGTIAGLEDGDIVEFDGTEFVIAFDVSAEDKADGTIAWAAAEQYYVRFVAGVWSEFGGLSALNAGNGLIKDGNTVHVNMGAGISELPSDEVGIDVRPNAGLMLTVDGSTASTASEAQLAVVVNAATMQVDASGVGVKAAGITEVEIATTALGFGLQGGNGVTLSVKAADASVIVDGDGVKVSETHLDGIYARQDGADFTGAVTVQAPVVDAAPTTKLYVDTAVSDLQDDIDALALKVSGGHFVYDGTASAQAVHTVTHNIGVKYVGVTVVVDDEVVLPENITFVDANSLTVSFSQPVQCRVVVNGAKA